MNDVSNGNGGVKPPEEWSALQAEFHGAGMRLTRQRLAIYRELKGRFDHPDVERLYQSVKLRIPQISRFTVYRTMNALENAGMAWRVATFKGHARYDGHVETHAHFLCETCGRIVDIEVGDLSDLCQKVAGDSKTIRRVDLMFHGEGPICRAARREEARQA